MLMEEVFERLREYQEILTKRGRDRARGPRDTQGPRCADGAPLARQKILPGEERGPSRPRRTKVRELRQQLAEAEGSREAAEKQMDAISTQREYEALNKEIRDATDPRARHPQGPSARGALPGRDRGVAAPRRVHDPAPGRRDRREGREDKEREGAEGRRDLRSEGERGKGLRRHR